MRNSLKTVKATVGKELNMIDAIYYGEEKK